MTTKQERDFADAVRAGHLVLCSRDVYDALKARNAVGDYELCQYLSPGTIVTMDQKKLADLYGFKATMFT